MMNEKEKEIERLKGYIKCLDWFAYEKDGVMVVGGGTTPLAGVLIQKEARLKQLQDEVKAEIAHHGLTGE